MQSVEKKWMTGVLFDECVRKVDSSFRDQSRKVTLLTDNCPAHPEIKNFTNINLVFLPQHTTSVLQPMDEGVIRSLKAHYRKKVVCLSIKTAESNNIDYYSPSNETLGIIMECCIKRNHC